MKNKKTLWLIPLLAVLGMVLFSELHFIPEHENYTQALKKQRTIKDSLFREGDESPIENKAQFKGLSYFEPDTLFRVKAIIEKFQTQRQFSVIMSGGTAENYTSVGRAIFSLAGKSHSLLLFENKEGELFLPFRDATNGKTTYGGGRYVEIPAENHQGNTVLIDFNQTYQPFCAYNHGYTCPIPPPENTLIIEIRAGERL